MSSNKEELFALLQKTTNELNNLEFTLNNINNTEYTKYIFENKIGQYIFIKNLPNTIESLKKELESINIDECDEKITLGEFNDIQTVIDLQNKYLDEFFDSKAKFENESINLAEAVINETDNFLDEEVKEPVLEEKTNNERIIEFIEEVKKLKEFDLLAPEEKEKFDQLLAYVNMPGIELSDEEYELSVENMRVTLGAVLNDATVDETKDLPNANDDIEIKDFPSMEIEDLAPMDDIIDTSIFDTPLEEEELTADNDDFKMINVEEEVPTISPEVNYDAPEEVIEERDLIIPETTDFSPAIVNDEENEIIPVEDVITFDQAAVMEENKNEDEIADEEAMMAFLNTGEIPVITKL